MSTYSIVRATLQVSLCVTIFFVMSMPSPTLAATSKPTCVLTVHTNIGTTTIEGKGEVLLQKNNEIEIAWKSTSATKAIDGDLDNVAFSGSVTTTPKKNTLYSYQFSNGKKKVTCAVSVTLVSGSFATSTLPSKTVRSTLSGKVSGIKTVQIQIFKEGSTTALYTSKEIAVKRGVWKATILKELPNGKYTVSLLGVKNRALNTFVSEVVTVGRGVVKKDTSQGTLVVQSVPLLLGGTARVGAVVPVAYLQVINIGKSPVTIHGFKVVQTGSADTKSIVSLTVVDDSESLGGSTGGDTSQTPFIDRSAMIPVDAVFAGGQMRLFTIKAVLASNVSPYLGGQLKINVTGVDTTATLQNNFPIRGTVWTIGL